MECGVSVGQTGFVRKNFVPGCIYLYIGFSFTVCWDDRYLFLLPKLKRPSDEDVFYLHPMVLYFENRGGYTIIRFLLLTAFDE